MYTTTNFKTKKAFKDAVKAGQKIRLFSPVFGPPAPNGRNTVEGPWYPEPHRWYANVEMREGFVVKVT